MAAKEMQDKKGRRVSLGLCRKGGPAACRCSWTAPPHQQRTGRASFLDELLPASSLLLTSQKKAAFLSSTLPQNPSLSFLWLDVPLMETFPPWPLNPQETHKGPALQA